MPNTVEQKTLVVLGGTGRIARLLQAHWRVNPMENHNILWVGRRKAPGVTHTLQNLGDVESLPQCNAIFSLWGVVSGDADALSANTELAKTAQEIARNCGADRVFHASSAAVYRPSAQAVCEEDELAPRNPYGLAKAAMEQAIAGASPTPVSLRLANVVGAGSLFDALGSPEQIKIDQFDGGHGPIRSFLRISTLAKVIEALMACPVRALPAALNVADQPVLDMAEIVRAAGRDFVWQAAGQGALPRMDFDLSRLVQCCPLATDPVDAEQIVEEWQSLRALV